MFKNRKKAFTHQSSFIVKTLSTLTNMEHKVKKTLM